MFLCREENGTVAVDFNIALSASVDVAAIEQALKDAFAKVVSDGNVGGYEIVPLPEHSVNVHKPGKGEL